MCRECAQHPELAVECRRLRTEALRRIYLFQEMSAGAVDSVVDGMDEIELEADQWVFFRREPASHFFLVLEGDVALVRYSPDGDELIVAIVGPGELFEEDLLLVEEARHCFSARCLGDCRLARFDRLHVQQLLADEPALVLELARTIHRRNVLLLDELERLTIQDAGERLISFLTTQAADSGEGFPLRVPKHVLASRLSIRPETLSRVLGRLKDCGRIHEADGNLLLLPAPEDACRECESCPARMWGCPGPRAARARQRNSDAVGLEHAIIDR